MVWCAVSGYFLAILSNLTLLLNGNIFFDHPEKFDDRQVFDDLKVISNESIDHDDPKEFDDPQLYKDPKGISIGSMGLIIQRSTVHCSDTSIFDGLVLTCLISYHIHNYYNHSYHFRCVHLFYHIFVLNAFPKLIVNSSFVVTFPCHAIMRSRWLFKETSPVPVKQLGRVWSRLDNHLVGNSGRF